MPLSLAEIQREASQLSLDERARLISHLIATLEPTEEGDIEAAWEKEVLARSKAIQEGRVAAVPADEALARVRSSLILDFFSKRFAFICETTRRCNKNSQTTYLTRHSPSPIFRPPNV